MLKEKTELLIFSLKSIPIIEMREEKQNISLSKSRSIFTFPNTLLKTVSERKFGFILRQRALCCATKISSKKVHQQRRTFCRAAAISLAVPVGLNRLLSVKQSSKFPH